MDELRIEKNRLAEFEIAANKEINEQQESKLSYRDLNSRFFEMEESNLNGEELANKKAERLQKKRQIENEWHTKTSLQANEIHQANRRKGSKSSKTYYRDFSLKQMETLIKNSDRGGNSKEFNDVATDLELYNRMTEKADENELMTLLVRLQQSAQKYVNERGGRRGTPKGRIRKAMISSLLDKVNTKVDEQRLQYKNAATNSYESMNAQKNDRTVNRACLDHFNLISNVLRGNITLNKEEREQLDDRMTEIVNNLKEVKIGEFQNPVLTTKFLNAIGWTEHKPTLINEDIEFGSDIVKYSPVGKVMYHAINARNGKAVKMGKQLLGFGEETRQYLSDGMYGKGTYLAARGSGADDGEEGNMEVRRHGISKYGENVGSLSFVMVHNEHARVISSTDLQKKMNSQIKVLFPKMYEALSRGENAGARNGGDSSMSMFGALLGYNTINGGECGTKQQYEYYVTYDRKALTIYDEPIIRTSDNQFSDNARDVIDARMIDVRNMEDDYIVKQN